MKPLKKSLSSNEITKQSSPKKSLLKRSASSNAINNQKLSHEEQKYIAQEYPRFTKAVYKLALNTLTTSPKNKLFFKNFYKLQVGQQEAIDEYIAKHFKDEDFSWDNIKDFINTGGKNLKYKNMQFVKNINDICEKILTTKSSKLLELVKNTELNSQAIRVHQAVMRLPMLLEGNFKVWLEKRKLSIGDLDSICKECKKLTMTFQANCPKNIYNYFKINNESDFKKLYQNLIEDQNFIEKQLKKGKED